MRMMAEKNLIPHYGNFSCQNWRETRYWNEEVDNIYKAHFPIFEKIFKSYSGKHMKPGDKQFMMADEFEVLIVNGNLIGDTYA
jgi:hypothetical protein